jgi:hypothetical protein
MSSVQIALASALCVGVGLLAACSKPAHQGPPSGAPASLANGPPGVVTQADLPRVRAGEWELVDPTDPAATVRTCMLDRPFGAGDTREGCQAPVFHRTADGGYLIDADCSKNGVTSRMQLTMHGDPQSAYSTDARMTLALRPGDAPRTSDTHTDYRYIGPCSASDQARAEAIAKGAGAGG